MTFYLHIDAHFAVVTLIAFIQTGGSAEEKYDLPVSYLKVYRKDCPVAEPSLLFSPLEALISPAKDVNKFYFPTTDTDDCCYPSVRPHIGLSRYQLRERGML